MTAPSAAHGPQVDAATALAQAAASNPKGSAWVSANAGSGKTFVLSRRVIRLLLAGADPSRILCLTFTKAAAAEMAKRVFQELARWTTLSDAELTRELAAIEGSSPDTVLLAEARRLFARALDTPGGLKIQTIHALCERLLHLFPFEANVAGHFEVLDERGQRALSDEARRKTLALAAQNPTGPLGRALATVLAGAGDMIVETSVAEFVEKRDAIGAWITAADGFDKAIAQLRQALGVGATETSEGLRRDVLAGGPLDAAAAGQLLSRLRRSGTSDAAAADRLAPYVESSDADLRIDAWLDFLLKDDGDTRSATSVATKAVRQSFPGLDELVDAEQARLVGLLDRIRSAELYESTVAMLQLADAAIGEYARLKQSRGVLDFEDLVVKTVRLLSRADASRWVHYKLDRGLDHILVDEAQDTSPRQWQVIKALAEEFFAGEGASETIRTLFAVGDEKQSIFSFQGAVPAWFTRVQRELSTRALGAERDWADLQLHLSFRSTPVVLAAVDEAFKAEAAHRGLSAELRAPLHTARRINEPGRVVVWPRYEPPEKPEPRDWSTPVDHLGRQSPEVRLAERIAGTIRDWLDRGEALEATGKLIRPGGILILSRTRGALTDAINRALKTRSVPIAGADRLTLTEHIAVMDLIALGRAVLTPADDLSLAALLKSPLVGFDEDALYALAHGRKGSLSATLAARSGERADFARAKALLDGWRAEADYRDPHGFFARILAGGRGRNAFLRRLGPEADDVLDEFLASALAYEQTDIPSLEGFLAWLVASETEIKRDTDTLRDEVRVMTVHGAKGLEADIVFLVDNGTVPAIAGHDPRVLPLAGEPDPERPGPVAWMRSIKMMPANIRQRVAAWREKSEEEYRRLLYVGMTRARDRLYVVGIIKQKLNVDGRWHPLVRQALDAECAPSFDDEGNLTALEWRPPPTAAAVAVRPEATADARPEMPAWTRRDASPAPAVALRVSPSAALPSGGEPDFGQRRVVAARFDRNISDALDRGRLVHRLLQSLPDHPPATRAVVGRRYLEAFAVKRADREELLGEVMAILDDPTFAPVFAEGSRAEVEIAGRIARAAGAAVIAGRIDRLAVTPDRVLVVDYKTNRPAPKSLTNVPRDYVAQLALYRRVLSRLYPGRKLVAALLWTDDPSLMEIPAESMDSGEVAFAAG